MATNDLDIKVGLINDLLKERNLWEVYKQARTIKDSPINRWIVIVFTALCILNSCLTKGTCTEIATQVRNLADYALNLDGTLLGFLAAGFAICASVTRPQLFMRMATEVDPNTHLTYLKTNFFLFMRVFFWYLVFMLLCLSVKLFGQPGGVASALIAAVRSDPTVFKLVVVKMALP